MTEIPKPLFRDPIHDGAADPTVIWNRAAGEWWMFYTNRRVWAPPIDDVSWVFGTDIGIASSADGGATWSYRGTARGLETGWGRDTFWRMWFKDDDHGIYFTHPGRLPGEPARDSLYAHRRTSIQVARARVAQGRLVCDRDEALTAPILPPGGPPLSEPTLLTP